VVTKDLEFSVYRSQKICYNRPMIENKQLDRREVLLQTLGFAPPAENEDNPWLWFNKEFNAIEVELLPDSFVVTGSSSVYTEKGTTLEELATAITNQLLHLFSILADSELSNKE